MKRRVISLILFAALLISALSVGISAEEATPVGQEYSDMWLDPTWDGDNKITIAGNGRIGNSVTVGDTWHVIVNGVRYDAAVTDTPVIQGYAEYAVQVQIHNSFVPVAGNTYDFYIEFGTGRYSLSGAKAESYYNKATLTIPGGDFYTNMFWFEYLEGNKLYLCGNDEIYNGVTPGELWTVKVNDTDYEATVLSDKRVAGWENYEIILQLPIECTMTEYCNTTEVSFESGDFAGKTYSGKVYYADGVYLRGEETERYGHMKYYGNNFIRVYGNEQIVKNANIGDTWNVVIDGTRYNATITDKPLDGTWEDYIVILRIDSVFVAQSNQTYHVAAEILTGDMKGKFLYDDGFTTPDIIDSTTEASGFKAYISTRASETENCNDIRFVVCASDAALRALVNPTVKITFTTATEDKEFSLSFEGENALALYSSIKAADKDYAAASGYALFGVVITGIGVDAFSNVELTINDQGNAIYTAGASYSNIFGA